MKTVINAKIIFDTDRYQGVHADEGAKNILTVRKIVKALRGGDFELIEVIWNELMTDTEITLVIRDRND